MKQLEYIYGIHPVQELIKARKRPIIQVYVTKQCAQSHEKLLKNLPAKTQISIVERNVLDRLVGPGEVHQGIIATTQSRPITKRSPIPSQASAVVLLDGVTDPHNVGAIIRSAYCTGHLHIIIPEKNAATITPVVVKASAGTIEHCTIYSVANAVTAAEDMKKAGYTLYCMALGGEDIRQLTPTTPYCVVIGSEGKGIQPRVLHHGHKITLPQVCSTSSYNASVAAGIALFYCATGVKQI